MNRVFSIYTAFCSATGRYYVGFTIQPVRKRWYQHKWNAFQNPKCHFHKAIKKYGIEQFQFEEVFCGFDMGDVKTTERHFVEMYDSYNNGYNSTAGGDDFRSSDFQKDLQNFRVKNGTHPFLGGTIQAKTSKRRWNDGTSPLIGLNNIRVRNGTHNLLGSSNPQIQRKQQGVKHHNQKGPWNNTKMTPRNLEAWRRADELYLWFVQNSHRDRGGSYKAMAAAFGLECNLQLMYYKYFKAGWNPNHDPEWLLWKKS